MTYAAMGSIPLTILAAIQGAAEGAPGAPWTPHVAAASDEWKGALDRVQLPPGYRASLFAAEPRLANPVSFTIDHRGAFYVAETFRLHDGVTDIRDHMDWCDDDLASRTVEDRVALLRKHLGPAFEATGRACDRVKWIADLDGDGLADADRVLDDDFRTPASGIGAGLLARNGAVYYTCIPDLWILEDPNRDGHLTQRRSLHRGYGVHITMIGHDLHGLRIGPDGRLYFSIGDRGLHVETLDGTIEQTRSGAVLRCELDGSRLEVFATGLRNPQELAFDEFGNLFTGDNNCDGGDRARWVYVVEGSDSGYRYGYQWMGDPYLRGPWSDEKLWHPHFAGQAAYIVPPVAWLGAGPAGIVYNPGTGLAESDRGHFFTCDFEGSPATSAIFRFAVQPKGAGFELGPVEPFVKGMLPTDVEFGPDGCLYWLDWVAGWGQSGKGRIFRIEHESRETHPRIAETHGILAEGMRSRDATALEDLLTHPDFRVRQEAQFELVERGGAGVEILAAAARAGKSTLTRLHGVWGLAQADRLGRMPPGRRLAPLLCPLLLDPDAEVRAQVAQACGDRRIREAGETLTQMLLDASPRVQLHAALALGKVGYAKAAPVLFDLAARIGESDPVLRHGVIVGLTGCAGAGDLLAASELDNADARVAAAVALRRLGDARVERFLKDGDPRVVGEAARAVYDEPLEAALPALAALLDDDAPSRFGGPALRRALAAALRLGGETNAARLGRFVARAELPEALRLTALEHLAAFAKTPGRDPVCGEWRPFPRGDWEGASREQAARQAVVMAPSLVKASEAIRLAWLRLVEVQRAADAAAHVAQTCADGAAPRAVRARAVAVLEALDPPNLAECLTRALDDADPLIRVEALRALVRKDPERSPASARRALAGGSIPELRFAYGLLEQDRSGEADELLTEELRRLDAGLIPEEARLELVAAARARPGFDLESVVPSRAEARRLDSVVTPWLDSLYGGDADRGRALFRNDAAVACLRCHRGGDGDGGQVGPDLRGVGARLSRLQILEAIVDPNRRITPGYEGVVLELRDGSIVSGHIEHEEGGTVSVRTPLDTRVAVEDDAIVERRADLSAMPEGLGKFLSFGAMRDLIEYLAAMK